MKKLAFAILIFLVSALGYFLYFQKPHALDPPPDEIVLFTIPKTGTHFMRPFLEYLTDQTSVSYWAPDVKCQKIYIHNKKKLGLIPLLPQVVQPYWLHQPIHKSCFANILDNLKTNGDFLVTHASYSQELENLMKKRNSLVFFLIRDPRDWIISVIKHPPISGVDIFGQSFGDKTFIDLDFDQKIHMLISGTATYYSVAEIYKRFLPWKNSSVCCTLRFEALMGLRGGHPKENQILELRKVAKALQLDVSDEILLDGFQDSFGTGTMFLKGKAGVWKDYFKEEHKIAFKKEMGDLLIELDYERNNQW